MNDPQIAPLHSPQGSLHERHTRVMPDWMSLYYDEPLELLSGAGRTVQGSDGRSYLDCFGGLLATMVGHNIPEITEAIQRQAARILHSSTLYLLSGQVRLAERLAAASRMRDPRVFFVNSGSEAVETALLITTAHASSNQVLALRGSYPGRSFGTVATTGIRAWSATGFSPLQVSYLHSGYRYRSPFRALEDAAFVDACIDEMRTIIETSTSGRIAAMLVEPVQGAGGFAEPPAGFFARTKGVLDEYGIPLISDEVQTAWGRTGRSPYGIHAHGVDAEVLTLAKGIANGLSIGAVVAEAEIMHSLPAHSISTAGGNPIAMAAANATLDYIEDHDLISHADQIGAKLQHGLHDLASRLPALIGEIRGAGLMIGVELIRPGSTDPAPELAVAAVERARKLGLLIGRGGLYGNVLRVTPPMTITAAEAETALELLGETLQTVDAAARQAEVTS
ncbi:aspartate aminotransferase family protein [Leucobacter sp. 7(1)]|uniref:aspartate aminotransferase family protein n=1 Tax=Leucobacter sp. 7(1) TaxID=1255613 RepID=UPI000B34D411|nr:aminotransferase class III-fold pyridoxal phosphate-dependent enzyme [Leucobacter sp. 7(1)]